MFISRKKYERDIARAVEDAVCKVEKREYENQVQVRNMREMDELRMQIAQLNEKVNELRGIKKKYDDICAVVSDGAYPKMI